MIFPSNPGDFKRSILQYGRKLFHELDVTEDNLIGTDEMMDWIEKTQATSVVKDSAHIFETTERDGDDFVTWSEFALKYPETDRMYTYSLSYNYQLRLKASYPLVVENVVDGKTLD